MIEADPSSPRGRRVITDSLQRQFVVSLTARQECELASDRFGDLPT
jgi:hypothetical protein